MSEAPSGLSYLTRSPGMIERDGLLAYLRSKGIEAVSPPRDLSRKISGTTIDLAYGGYSAVFEGFAIYVKPGDLELAKEHLRTFESKMRLEPDPKPVNYAHKFYLSSLFTVLFPGFMHALAIYHLIKAVRQRERFSPIKMAFAILLLIATGALGTSMIQYYFP